MEQKYIDTVKTILRSSEKQDLDDNDYVLCGTIMCTTCPAYKLGDETPTNRCKLFWHRDWYWDNVIEPKQGLV